MKLQEGVRNLHIAPMTITAGKTTYETPVPVEDLEEISTTNNYAEGTSYSDNILKVAIKKPSFIEISITLSKILAEIESIIMGKSYENGKKVTSVTDKQVSFAVLYQITNADGTYTNRVLYNCTLAKDEQTNTTTKDAIEFDTVTLGGTAIPTKEGWLDLTMDSDDKDVDPEELSKFFEQVVLPGAKPTVKNNK